MSRLRKNIELSFTVLMLFLLIGCAIWFVMNVWWTSFIILILCPIVSFWLWKFYQSEIDKPTISYILNGFLGLIFIAFLSFMIKGNRSEIMLDKMLLHGRIISKVVRFENDESGIQQEERRFSFMLLNENDNWKKEIINWFVIILAVTSPVVTFKCITKISPKYNKEYEEQEIRDKRFWERI